MTDIVLLSALADADRVTSIIDALIEERLDARWTPIDETAASDAPDDAGVQAEIAAARCVLIAWSARTTAPDAVRFQALATLAVERGTAASVMIDDVDPPAALAATTRYDLSGWRGRPSFWRRWLGGGLYMRDVVAAARYKVAGRDPAPPSAPRAMLVRQVLATVPAVFAVNALVPTVYGFWKDLGIAGADETRAWQAIDPTNCAALRTFLSRFPDGQLAAQAQARLDGRAVKATTVWHLTTRKMPLYVGNGLATAMPSQARAGADLDSRIADAAGGTCRGLAEAGNSQFVRFTLLPGSRACATGGDGIRCSFDGSVACALKEPVAAEVEECRPAR